jgi:hypothetical protein
VKEPVATAAELKAEAKASSDEPKAATAVEPPSDKVDDAKKEDDQ